MKNIKNFIFKNYKLILLSLFIICLIASLNTIVLINSLRDEIIISDEFSNYYSQSHRLKFFSDDKKQELSENDAVDDIIGFSYVSAIYGLLNINNNKLFDYVSIIDGDKITSENQAVVAADSQYKIGDTFNLSNDDVNIEFRVVGIYDYNIWPYFSEHSFEIIINNRLVDEDMVYDIFLDNDSVDLNEYGVSLSTYQDISTKHRELSQYLSQKYDWIHWFVFSVIGIMLVFYSYIFAKKLYNSLQKKYWIFLPPIILLTLSLLLFAFGVNVSFIILLPYMFIFEIINIILYFAREDKICSS